MSVNVNKDTTITPIKINTPFFSDVGKFLWLVLIIIILIILFNFMCVFPGALHLTGIKTYDDINIICLVFGGLFLLSLVIGAIVSIIQAIKK
jgi:flagellar biosynthesis protein FliQ